jgi:hypothetical protein
LLEDSAQRAELLERLDAATPGVWAVELSADGVVLEPRPPSRLFDGISLRACASPLAAGLGPIPKPHPLQSPYTELRRPGVVALLYGDDRELWESCSSSVLGFDGEQLFAVPNSYSRVWSTAEWELVEALGLARRPIVPEQHALLLVNALGCVVPTQPHPFPGYWRERVEAVFSASVCLSI